MKRGRGLKQMFTPLGAAANAAPALMKRGRGLKLHGGFRHIHARVGARVDEARARIETPIFSAARRPRPCARVDEARARIETKPHRKYHAAAASARVDEARARIETRWLWRVCCPR